MKRKFPIHKRIAKDKKTNVLMLEIGTCNLEIRPY